MRSKLILSSLLTGALVVSASAGTYANISIDGNFADWVDVPVLVTDPEELDTGVDFAEIKVANDDQGLYIYMKLHRAANAFDFFPNDSNYFVDGDDDAGTGFAAFGGLIGSEVFIQGPDAFQEAGGGFNEGTLAAGTVLQSPFGVSADEFEFSIDRNVVGVAAPFLGLSLISGTSVSFAFQGAASPNRDELVFSYDFANPPACVDVLPTTFKTILIDGDFSDWDNVPAVAVDPVEADAGVDFSVIRMANDSDFIYLLFELHSPGDPFLNFPDETNIFVDGDGNPATGLSVFGGIAGSEILIQGSTPDAYQEAGGGFNEGPLAAGFVTRAPATGAATKFEVALDRGVLGVAGAFIGQPLITGSTIALALQGTDQPGDTGSKDEILVEYDVIDTPCPGVPAPGGVDATGRPLGDLDGNCTIDIVDFSIMQLNITGP